MSDDDEEAPPLLNALTATQTAHVLNEVGHVVADVLWDFVLYRFEALPPPGSDDEAELAERTETHLLDELADKGLLVVRATADPTDAALLFRRLRALFLALLRFGHVTAEVHASARAIISRAITESLPSPQADPEHAFDLPPIVLNSESCEAFVKDAIKRAVVQALGLGAADPLQGLLASPMALHISEREMDDESEVDEGGDIGDSSDDEEDEESDDASDEGEEASEEETEEGGSPPPKRCKE